jgi:hypothetical protein
MNALVFAHILRQQMHSIKRAAPQEAEASLVVIAAVPFARPQSDERTLCVPGRTSRSMGVRLEMATLVLWQRIVIRCQEALVEGKLR